MLSGVKAPLLPSHQRCPHFLALRAKFAFFRIAGERDLLSRRSVETGMFLPFLVFVALRREPCFEGLMWIFRPPLRRLVAIPPPPGYDILAMR